MKSHEKCNEQLYNKVSQQQMCAGSEGEDTCQGKIKYSESIGGRSSNFWRVPDFHILCWNSILGEFRFKNIIQEPVQSSPR